MRLVRASLAIPVLATLLIASYIYVGSASRVPAQTTEPVFGFGMGDFTEYNSSIPTQIASINPHSVVRIGIDWAQMQPNCTDSGNTEFECLGGPKPINFQTIDGQVSSYKAAGIKVLFDVSQAPSWAWSPLDCPVGGCWNNKCNSQTCVNELPPANNSTDLGYWETFIQDLVSHYQTNFPGEVTGIEVWNEENAASGWTTTAGPNAGRYASLLCYAYNGDQGAPAPLPVIMGGLQTEPTVGTNTVSIPSFVGTVYQDGAGTCMNAIGLHIYPGNTSADNSQSTSYASFHNGLATMQQALTANGAGNFPIWITELGYCTGNSTSPYCSYDGSVGQTVSSTLQAQYLECAFQLAVGIPQIQAMFLFTVDDAPGAPPVSDYAWNQFGVYSYPGSAKTAVTTLSTLFSTYPTGNVPAITQWNDQCADVAISA